MGILQDHPVQQTDQGIADDQRCRFTAGQHIIADADLLVHICADAFVKAFVMPAKQDQMFLGVPAAAALRLIEGAGSLRRHHDHM